jgi:hypothetical protein
MECSGRRALILAVEDWWLYNAIIAELWDQGASTPVAFLNPPIAAVLRFSSPYALLYTGDVDRAVVHSNRIRDIRLIDSRFDQYDAACSELDCRVSCESKDENKNDHYH